MYQGVTTEEAMILHRMVIDRFGGAVGVRDSGQLEASLQAPTLELFGGPAYETLGRAAGALMHGLAHSHPFLDGNKRAAIVITAHFLGKNGYRMMLTEAAMEHLVLSAAKGEDVRQRLGEILETNICRIGPLAGEAESVEELILFTED